jgi:hypothetical protein
MKPSHVQAQRDEACGGYIRRSWPKLILRTMSCDRV